LLALPSVAHAGLHLRWNACYGEAAAAENRTFACDTNSGSELLVASYELPDTVTGVVGITCNFRLLDERDLDPSWWVFKTPGSCRQNSLTLAIAPDPSWSACTDVSGGTAYFSQFALTSFFLQTGGRITTLQASDVFGSSTDIGPKMGETFAIALRIDHKRTTDCAGCAYPICIAFDSIRFHAAAPASDVVVTSALDPSLLYVAEWQGSHDNNPCFGVPTNARSSTWGAIKSLYR
jgi:hypothetical protein